MYPFLYLLHAGWHSRRIKNFENSGKNKFVMSSPPDSAPPDSESQMLKNNFARLALVLAYPFIFGICFFGNAGVILDVWCSWKKKRRSVSNFWFGNLAAANLAASLFCIVQNLTLFLLDGWIFGEFMCKMYHFITNLWHTASILIHVSISIERYIFIRHPIRHRNIFSTRKLSLITLAIWLTSTLISLPTFWSFGLTQIEAKPEGGVADLCVPMESIYNSSTVDMLHFLLLYLIPLAFVIGTYRRIRRFIRETDKLRRELIQLNTPAQRLRYSAGNLRANRKQLDKNNGDAGQEWRRRAIRQAQSAIEEPISVPLKPHVPSPKTLYHARGPARPKRIGNNVRAGSSGGSRRWEEHKTYPGIRVVRTPATPLDGTPPGSSTDSFNLEPDFGARPDSSRQRMQSRSMEENLEVKGHGGGDCVEGTSGSYSETTTSAFSTVPQRETTSAGTLKTHVTLCRYNRHQVSQIRYRPKPKSMRMFILTVVIFAVLTLPYHVVKIYQGCCHPLTSGDVITPLTFALMYANCAVNPIIYALMSK